MPSPHIAAWKRLLATVEAAAELPLAKASVLDAMRARLQLEDELNADGHAFGDVDPDVVERAQAAVKALTVKVSRLAWAERPRSSEVGPLGLSWPLWPVQVTSPFGARRHPISGEAKQHHGLDVYAYAEQPIGAAAPGTVLFAGWNGAHGKQVEVLHDEHTTTSYSHLASLLTEPGAEVKRGQLLGLAGQTGRATGVHLHFEVRRDGEAIDPMTVMPSPYESPSEEATR
jgi:murein DD-endopeptidase MepM/ murein hydrolase activator NlpD